MWCLLIKYDVILSLRIGRLPSWAKKSLGNDLAAPETPPEPPARGKWATRILPTNGKCKPRCTFKHSLKPFGVGRSTSYFWEDIVSTLVRNPHAVSQHCTTQVSILAITNIIFVTKYWLRGDTDYYSRIRTTTGVQETPCAAKGPPAADLPSSLTWSRASTPCSSRTTSSYRLFL